MEALIILGAQQHLAVCFRNQELKLYLSKKEKEKEKNSSSQRKERKKERKNYCLCRCKLLNRPPLIIGWPFALDKQTKQQFWLKKGAPILIVAQNERILLLLWDTLLLSSLSLFLKLELSVCASSPSPSIYTHLLSLSFYSLLFLHFQACS